MPTAIRAAWVLPIDQPPIRDGWIAVDRGRITGVGSGPLTSGPRPLNLGSVAILPGLVNAHTHLELSWMRGRVPPARKLPDWIRTLIAVRSAGVADALTPLEVAIAEAHAAGTILIGDIGNTALSVGPLERSRMAAVVFRELIGFNPGDARRLVDEARAEIERHQGRGRVRLTLAAHAPYSVSPCLLREIGAAQFSHPQTPRAIHLSESPEEVEFIASGGGKFRTLLEDLGVWHAHWECPQSGTLEYLERSGFVDARMLAVHGVHLSDDELARLAARGATLVTCPRSNQWTGGTAPPVRRFYASGVRVAVGTDSLASGDDLNVFSELHELRRLAPEVPARTLLESATRHGADALGFGEELGTLTPGKSADLLGVQLPHDVDDVEEYLVSGIQPRQLRWVAERQ